MSSVNIAASCSFGVILVDENEVAMWENFLLLQGFMIDELCMKIGKRVISVSVSFLKSF